MKKLKLQYVHFMPNDLDSGILYVSIEYGIAGHLCPCGCGNKIMTPLDPTEWSFYEEKGEPTLYPSIGNWQLPCRSHYWINKGRIEWSYNWTDKQVEAGRKAESEQKKQYYNKRNKKPKSSQLMKKYFPWLYKKND